MIQGKVSLLSRNVALVTLVFALALAFAFSLAFAPLAHAATLVGPKANYLALGDSLGFGFQPNGDENHGYANDFFSNLQSHGTTTLENLSCSGETTTTMINGGCIDKAANHVAYAGAQLTAAVNFINAHKGQVSPVTLDVGADNFLLHNDVNTNNSPNCTVNMTQFNSDLATVDNDLKNTILPELTNALTVNGQRTGDLIIPNYYDPEQNLCPNLVSLSQEINAHIASDASGFGVVMVDIFTAFGGPATPNNNLPTLTWITSNFPLALAIHPRSVGYQLMATTIENTVGY
jgi:lysophospholipase L1-like esterase